MFAAKFDHTLGGFVILELKQYRFIDKFLSCHNWKIIYSFGDTSVIQFKLNELISKSDCLLFSRLRCCASIDALIPQIQIGIDETIKKTKEDKISERFLIQKVREEIVEEELRYKQAILSIDKKLRNFKNINLTLDLEKRGLINSE